MANKIGPLENIVGEEIVSYNLTSPDHKKKLNGNLVLGFKSGKTLFISSISTTDGESALFFSPEDEN